LEDADRQDDQWSESFTTASTKNGATYRIQEFSSTYENIPVRLIVVESSALDKKKEKTLQKQRQEEYAFLVESQKAFEKRSFHCEADAIKELETWKQKYSLTFHRVHATIESQETIKRKPGRPKKEEEPQRITTYRIVFTHIESDEEAFQKVKRKASRFVLITTVPTEYEGQAMTAQEILALYKGQSSVEMNFSFLKDPFFVDEIYLKKPHRVQVLAYLFLLALLVYRVFQWRIRQHVTEKKPLMGAGRRKLIRPTGKAIFQLFQHIQVAILTLPTGEKIRQFGFPLSYEQKKVLEYLGMDETIYL
jgi:transposase